MPECPPDERPDDDEGLDTELAGLRVQAGPPGPPPRRAQARYEEAAREADTRRAAERAILNAQRRLAFATGGLGLYLFWAVFHTLSFSS